MYFRSYVKRQMNPVIFDLKGDEPEYVARRIYHAQARALRESFYKSIGWFMCYKYNERIFAILVKTCIIKGIPNFGSDDATNEFIFQKTIKIQLIE